MAIHSTCQLAGQFIWLYKLLNSSWLLSPPISLFVESLGVTCLLSRSGLIVLFQLAVSLVDRLNSEQSLICLLVVHC
jgi:hypothetical protein